MVPIKVEFPKSNVFYYAVIYFVKKVKVPLVELRGTHFSELVIRVYRVTIFSLMKTMASHLIPWSTQDVDLTKPKFLSWFNVIEDKMKIWVVDQKTRKRRFPFVVFKIRHFLRILQINKSSSTVIKLLTDHKISSVWNDLLGN